MKWQRWRKGGSEGFALHIPSAISLSLCSLSPSHTPLVPPGHLCGPGLMGNRPRDGPVATFCLSLSTPNKLRPSHHVDMLMCGALGLLIEMPVCSRGETEAVTPGPCQSGGVTSGGCTAFPAWHFFLFWLHSAPSLLGGLRRGRECEPPSHVLPPASIEDA